MDARVPLRLGVALGLMFAFGLAAVGSAPSSVHTGAMWPVGFASGALLLSRRTMAPYVATVIAILAAASFVIGGYPLGVALGFAVGVALEAALVHQVLTEGWTQRLRLQTNNDFARLVNACAAGAVVGAVVFTGVSALASFGTPWQVGISVFITHGASQLVMVGLFKDPVHQESEWGTKERWAAWADTIVVTTAAFVPIEMPSLAFLVVPALGWVALRAPMREAMLQLFVVSVIASTLTAQDRGPFSDPSLHTQLSPELQLLPLQAFLIACAMVTIPFSLTTGRQRRSAAEAQRERARSDRLLQSARGIAIIETDANGRITLFNPGAQLILGYAPEDVYGRSTRMFHTEAEIVRQAEALGCAPTFAEVIAAIRSLPPGTARDWEFLRKDGVPRMLSTILSPITDEAGRLVGYVATADDITDRLETQAALEAALETERAAVERLTEVDQAKDRFVSSVSHELRTPITNIVGYLELIMDGLYGKPTDDQARAMSRIDLNSRRLLTLIDDLLTLSRVESLDQPREIAPVDLVAVIRRAEEIVRPSLLGRDLRLTTDIGDEPVVVSGDNGGLERLVINLATNAVKFTPDGGEVTLRLIPSQDGVGPVLEVEDTGIGIPESDQAMLFSRFFRATQARESAVPGSGLGLSIAKSIAELHGGAISATSVPGDGSTFRVEFPPLRRRSPQR